jgi:hypothetical protein
MMKKVLFVLIFAVDFVFVISSVYATSFLEEEAGICAYTNAGRAIDLAKVKPLYRTIEHETSEYVIGSIPIGDYAETEDTHVYINKDGWVAAYYSATEPVSKIVDWRSYQGAQITSTKLELALKAVATAVNFPLVNVKYYDFVCPQANKLLIVADKADNDETDTFDILIPDNGVTIYESSWTIYGIDAGPELRIDDNIIITMDTGDIWEFKYGKLTPDQLKPGLFHKITTKDVPIWQHFGWVAGAIVLVYQQP